MRDLKIVFMGTPDFAVATLQALVENNYTILVLLQHQTNLQDVEENLMKVP